MTSIFYFFQTPASSRTQWVPDTIRWNFKYLNLPVLNIIGYYPIFWVNLERTGYWKLTSLNQFQRIAKLLSSFRKPLKRSWGCKQSEKSSNSRTSTQKYPKDPRVKKVPRNTQSLLSLLVLNPLPDFFFNTRPNIENPTLWALFASHLVTCNTQY